ncbi:hypothetical protein LJ737_25685 [Hymenobacter sp. 15J16-1T3B]|uniref:hypothetical protein n=1 Tax=Hymenobacter sp. 15J16-1T3B TaxID=2886941 RepID=UPI001D11E342|nr:hypothetical protein [Hymenobacter sp. 15J16-1T3B]MCC3160656.1 hypothetical protein [Hymenobacter sp. 15J16-1T3B]
MRPELARLQRIEQHLLGPVPAAEAPAWQLAQLLDPELAADAQAQQQLYRGLQLAGRQQLRRELQAIHHQLYGPASAGWLRGAVGGLRALLRRGLRR